QQGTGSDGGGEYTSLDRFGRVIDQSWDSTAAREIDHSQYAYDADGNLLYKNDLVNPSMSELYTDNGAKASDVSAAYNLLNQGRYFERGQLSASGGSARVNSSVSSYYQL